MATTTTLPANVARFTFKVGGLDEELRVLSFSGDEGISQLYSFQFEVVAEDSEIKFDDIVGKAGMLIIHGIEDAARYVHGIISRMEQLGTGQRFTSYQLDLVPPIWLLSYRYDSRIFQDEKVEDIIKKVLDESGLSGDQYGFNLQGSYEPREYCVQYRESDFNYISRLMEEEGMFYFFEHTEDSLKLIIADSSSVHQTIPDPKDITYNAESSMVAHEEFINQFSYAEAIQPGAVVLRDFNFKKPSLNLESQKQAEAYNELEVYDYPGEFQEPGRGDALAQVRLEALQAARKIGVGQSDVKHLLPGYRFTLAHHEREDFNQDYLITSLTQSGSQPQVLEEGGAGQSGGYSNQFEVIPADVPFRPTARASKPLMEGVQTAIVVGPEGEEIYTDEHGRVKVQFHWDRQGEYNETSSCWIRVSQAWAGSSWGAIHIPRVGQEVIVNFIEGDPDRPIITGRVYHGTNRPPYALPDEKTKSTLKSNSSKGGEGFNEIRLEDKKGEEQIFVHAEKNQDIRVKHDRFEFAGHNRHLQVKQDKFEHIENNRNEKVDNDHLEEIGNDRNLKVGGKQAIEIGGSHSFAVTGDVIEVFKANHSEQTTSNYYLKAMGIVIESMSGITLKCGGSNIVIDPAGVTLKGPVVTVDGGMVKIASGPGSPPTSGSAGSAVAPAAPEQALEADTADPGKVSEVKTQKVAEQDKEIPFKPVSVSAGESEDEEKSWIEIELVDEEDNPIPGEKYKITLPDGSTKTGTLDQKGFARVEGIDPGTCKVTFPNLDKDAWEKA